MTPMRDVDAALADRLGFEQCRWDGFDWCASHAADWDFDGDCCEHMAALLAGARAALAPRRGSRERTS